MPSLRLASGSLIVTAVLAVACGGSSSAPPPASATTAPPAQASPETTAAPAMDPSLPPLPVSPFPAARPMDVVRGVYTFAAVHPEVLSKVPCFCGCESRGHRHNDDCFVSARDAKGRVTAWEPHGAG